VSDLVKTTNIPAGKGFLPDIDRGDMPVFQAPGINYSIPNLFINNWAISNAVTGPFEAELMTAAITVDPAQTNNFQDLETLLAVFILMKPSSDWLEGKTYWNETTITATECALHLCLKSFNTSIVQGNFIETVEDTWSTKVPLSYQDSHDQPSGIRILNYSALYTEDWNPPYQEFYINRTDFQLSIPTEVTETKLRGSPNVYNISQSALMSTLQFFDGLFKVLDSRFHQDSHQKVWHDARTMYSNNLLQPLFESKDLNATFAQIAASMTDRIRDTGAQTQPGTLQQWIYHFDIKWPFFFLPFAMSFLGCVYTVLTIMRNSKRGMPAWKTSMLATLAHGVDVDTEERLRVVEPEKQRSLARNTKVLLKENIHGMELARSNS